MSTATSTPNPGGKSAALIFLHGLGDTPAGWSFLEQHLPSIRPSLSQIHYVFPPAPTIGITINGGMQMPGWFDLYDWPIGISAKDDAKGKLESVKQINECVSRVMEQHGIPRDRIVVGGFSQGGAIALLTAYHESSSHDEQQPALAGCVALSGWLTLRDRIKAPSTASGGGGIPLFWGHGQFDDKVLAEQQPHGVQLLRDKGVTVTAKSYPMGHQGCEEEFENLATFLDQLLFSQ